MEWCTEAYFREVMLFCEDRYIREWELPQRDVLLRNSSLPLSLDAVNSYLASLDCPPSLLRLATDSLSWPSPRMSRALHWIVLTAAAEARTDVAATRPSALVEDDGDGMYNEFGPFPSGLNDDFVDAGVRAATAVLRRRYVYDLRSLQDHINRRIGKAQETYLKLDAERPTELKSKKRVSGGEKLKDMTIWKRILEKKK
mmetsp:Transcript_16762/g.37689  ORF Transcript_16762/g.37689 Transcript_16762/m.37689 type:complete len:199 (+) Transcript_16762:105-701(+)|eukprot:CAMPEP_0113331042 /NCGR_PEP_ID=MMETSP0010_2-20120614/22208_1 /TAXON_ID=216773 ORGANISM="Corethron hystrix, Strain 308" /NCGR_SAMPLE_ID=MMETSP0010_2 /ASSEMBLY_ACC=CAM_ASM_000155 /LENGTH=198 /DNA_ID=CAMNT_0000194143 /DNA_START=42 /DNA_END=638 /DNA_ORIENTATION=+ /assembly_acc=CAM_ASM_000155